MLAPRFDLPLARRGVVEFSVEETNSLFDPAASGDFEKLRLIRLARMTAPFGRVQNGAKHKQTGLFE